MYQVLIRRAVLEKSDGHSAGLAGSSPFVIPYRAVSALLRLGPAHGKQHRGSEGRGGRSQGVSSLLPLLWYDVSGISSLGPFRPGGGCCC